MRLLRSRARCAARDGQLQHPRLSGAAIRPSSSVRASHRRRPSGRRHRRRQSPHVVGLGTDIAITDLLGARIQDQRIEQVDAVPCHRRADERSHQALADPAGRRPDLGHPAPSRQAALPGAFPGSPGASSAGQVVDHQAAHHHVEDIVRCGEPLGDAFRVRAVVEGSETPSLAESTRVTDQGTCQVASRDGRRVR